MTVYVAEISGRGIVAFDAANEDAARAQLADMAFRRDLIVFQNQGRSLWDGVSEIHLRSALPQEAETWQAGQAASLHGRGAGHEGLVFLLPVVDPSTADDDDNDNDNDDDHDQGD